MTGPEHYREAEWLLRILAKPADHGGTVIDARMNPNVVAAAQAHATLALAAAVGLSEAVKVGAVPPAAYAGWADVAAPDTAPPAPGEDG